LFITLDIGRLFHDRECNPENFAAPAWFRPKYVRQFKQHCAFFTFAEISIWDSVGMLYSIAQQVQRDLLNEQRIERYKWSILL